MEEPGLLCHLTDSFVFGVCLCSRSYQSSSVDGLVGGEHGTIVTVCVCVCVSLPTKGPGAERHGETSPQPEHREGRQP